MTFADFAKEVFGKPLRLGCRSCNLPISDEEDRANNGYCDLCESCHSLDADEDYGGEDGEC